MDAPFVIALLAIAAIWGIYLLPSFFGSRRDAPLNSTEEFDRWTHIMADVQRRPFNARRATTKDIIRARRRRTLTVLGLAAAATLAMAYARGSLNWLLVHILIDAGIAWYVAMLVQVKKQREARVAQTHAVVRQADLEEKQVRVIAR